MYTGGRGDGAPYQKFQQVAWPKGTLKCSVVDCTSVLSMKKSDKFRATDKKNKSTAANGGQSDPHFSPVCSGCWNSDNVETLNQQCATPGKKMDMPKFRAASGHTRGYDGQKAKHSANAAAAIVVDNSDNESENGSIAGSISGASTVSTAESAKAAVNSAIAELQKHKPSLKVTMESSSEEVPRGNMDFLTKTMGDVQNFMAEQRVVQQQNAQNISILQRQQMATQVHQQASLRAGGLGGGYGTYVPPNGNHSQQQIELMAAEHRGQFPTKALFHCSSCSFVSL